MVIIRKFQLKSFLDTVVKYRIRRLIVPPPVLILLLKNPLVKQYDLTGLIEVRSGAAPLGKDMEHELKQRYSSNLRTPFNATYWYAGWFIFIYLLRNVSYKELIWERGSLLVSGKKNGYFKLDHFKK